jgi:hypothetical protein
MLGGFPNTRRTNANAGDMHSVELQVLRRVRSLAQWTYLQVQHVFRDVVYLLHTGTVPVSDYRACPDTWSEVAADKSSASRSASKGCGARTRDYAISHLTGRALESSHAGNTFANKFASSLISQTNSRLQTIACLLLTSCISPTMQ